MRLFLLTALVMTAFAANSVFNRLALVGGENGPASFALLRLAAGALVLLLLARLRRGGGVPWRGPAGGLGARAAGAGALAVYMLGFSFAYVSLPAGVGALILFGGVQLTMFLGALAKGERVTPRRWAGSGIAFGGLAVLLWPQGIAVPDWGGAALMAAAAAGWGVYSLLGRAETDPLGATAANFALALPVAVLVQAAAGGGLDAAGAALALVSGAVTSGAGYAVWYAVLPRLATPVAAVAQLSVPLIAFAGGVLLLGEAATLRFAVAAALVTAGIGLSLIAPRRGVARG